jgi:polyhydroxybutyrate depolymerase
MSESFRRCRTAGFASLLVLCFVVAPGCTGGTEAPTATPPATGGSGGSSGGAAGSTGGPLASGGSGGSAGSAGVSAASGGAGTSSGGTSAGAMSSGGALGGAGSGDAGKAGAAGATNGGSAGAEANGGASANASGAAAGVGGAAGGAGTGGSAGSGGKAATSPGCGTSEPLASGRASIDVAGSMREYILKVPADYDASQAYPLIFAFHARGGMASQVAGSGNDDYYGLHDLADGSAIFVSPEGLDQGWRNTDGRDIAFVRAMITSFSSKLCVDQERLFSVGFSFGGMMSDAIGCAMADVFRAIAPMAGGIPNPEHPYSGCDQPNMHPIAVWMAHGDNDTVVPLSDGKDALNLFLARNECDATTMPVDPSPCVAYQGCLEGYPIHYCEFSGGHGVPSFASEAIWNFFTQF